jgi:hypothetical protein
MVIALGVRLARDRDDIERVRTEPKPLVEFKPATFNYEQSDEWESSEEEQAPVQEDDEWSTVQDDRQTKRTKKRQQEKTEHYQKKQMLKAFEQSFPAEEIAEEDKSEPQAEEENSDIDDEKTGGEWVTQENLYKHISKGDSQALVSSEEAGKKTYIDIKEDAPQHVVFLTSDFAMQNVII